MPSPQTVRYRLRRGSVAAAPILLTQEQQSVTTNTDRRLRVLAGPGTGKTATLVEAVAERIEVRGVKPEEIAVLTFSRRAAGELTSRIARRLGTTTRTSMVRTLHSYAYSLVRLSAAARGEPAPRLLGAGESDQLVRDLLAGHVEDGAGKWPEFLRGALTSPAFAVELRDLLMRATERDLTPARISSLAKRLGRPEWLSVASFITEYRQVTDLRQASSALGMALDQAELTSAALAVLADDAVFSDEQRRVRRVFVDEYQDVDPAQRALIETIAAGADELVVFGDPDQSIYGFRGSDPSALRGFAAPTTVALTISRRLPTRLIAATRRLARSLPAPTAHRDLRNAAPMDGDAGELDVASFPSTGAQAAYIANRFRRAHLLDGVPWRQMAVLVRSPIASRTTIARAFSMAGVPVLVGASDQVVAADPLVGGLLLLLEVGHDLSLLTGEVALDLLGSRIGALDGLALRRLRRAVRVARPGQGSSADLLAAVLAGATPPAAIPRDLQGPLRRICSLVRIAVDGRTDPRAEDVLWRLWKQAGLQDALVSAAERGGPQGQRADHTLDAVLGLFSMAADLSDRLPSAGIAAFVALVRGQQIPGDPDFGDQRSADAVSVMSAHGSKGLEWDVVAVADVNEGSWPDLRRRGSLLAADELLDASVGAPPGDRSGSALLAQERRLFYVAATRARKLLICTGVQDEDSSASRFLTELLAEGEELRFEVGNRERSIGGAERGLNLADLVADLRRALTDAESHPADLTAAAAQLARLAVAHVPGAHPDEWYGLADLTTQAPPVGADSEVRLSPSLVESLNTCSLRAVLSRRGGRSEAGEAQLQGIVVHAMAHGLAHGVDSSDLTAEIETFLLEQDHLPPWQVERSRRALLTMLGAAQDWVRQTHPPRRLIGSELELDVLLPPTEAGSADGERPVRLIGRVDWMSERADGSMVVTDFKTGAAMPTKAAAQTNPQLGAYQTAVALGGFGDRQPGGAELVFLRTGKPKVLHQDRLSAESAAALLETIRGAARALASATAFATANPSCGHCSVRAMCPIQPDGRQVTR